GGDIVLTPGDARPKIAGDTEAMQIEIEVSRRAEVYVLFHAWSTPPAWLTRDYVKTPLRAGLDFDNSPHSLNASLGIGPGQSIDASQIVWKRKQTLEGRAVVTEHMTDSSAYVIVAVPAD
ncbi:MAG: hypothetical protein AAF085_17620, partial [Planctomycetota bacterium]